LEAARRRKHLYNFLQYDFEPVILGIVSGCLGEGKRSAALVSFDITEEGRWLLLDG
jgi:hypothetical protein